MGNISHQLFNKHHPCPARDQNFPGSPPPIFLSHGRGEPGSRLHCKYCFFLEITHNVYLLSSSFDCFIFFDSSFLVLFYFLWIQLYAWLKVIAGGSYN